MNDSHTIVGLGELLWDCFERSRRPGGAPANVAFHSQQLGGRGVVCSRVGQDPLGDELVSYLSGHGLSTEFVQHDSHHPTGTVTVDTHDPGAPHFTINTGVAWDYFVLSDEVTRLASQARAVCFGTLAQRYHVAHDAIQQFVERVSDDCLRVCDVNLRETWYDRDTLEWSLTHADVVKLNDEEVSRLGEEFDIKADGIAEIAEQIRRRFAIPLVCVTRGADGCLLMADDDGCDVPGAEVEVVDAVGAGDAFTAALIDARLAGWPLEQCGRFANDVGRLVVQYQGAMPDLSEEFAQLRQCYASA